MNEADIRRYAQLMQEMDLSGLEVDEKNQTVRLERQMSGAPDTFRASAGAAGAGAALSAMLPSAAAALAAGGSASGAGPLPAAGFYASGAGRPSAAPMEDAPSGEPGLISVMSPMVGTFYTAPAENADPFVRPGQRVEKGATLCIIEAMKLMNEIPTEDAGTIVEVLASDGQMVEYGTELFRIRKESA